VSNVQSEVKVQCVCVRASGTYIIEHLAEHYEEEEDKDVAQRP
jgi:hypothetical protein